MPAGLLPKTQSVGTDCRGHRRTRHGGESCGATASLTTSPDEPLFFLDLPLRIPPRCFPSGCPQKGRARGEKHSFATLEASVLGPSVTGVVRAHAFQIEASVPADSSQNHPLKSTKTLFFTPTVGMPRVGSRAAVPKKSGLVAKNTRSPLWRPPCLVRQ